MSKATKAIVSDHTFPSLDLQQKVLQAAGFVLSEIQPICQTEDDVIRQCGDADVLLVQWAPITRRTLESFSHLKGVVRYGIGVNNIDLDAARELNIGVANIPTYCLEEVSNHAMAMMLGLARRIPQDHSTIAHGGWGIGPLLPIPAFIDMTLGLIGFGAISRLVARKARAFGFRIAAYDPYVKDVVFQQNDVVRLDLDTLLHQADILSIHCPLVAETKHLIHRANIEKMKPGVLLINTSRGPIVKESDLIQALQEGRIVGAGLDVFEEEPLPLDSPLRGFSNVLLTSHAASVSNRAVEALQIKAAEAARDFLQDRKPEGALVWPPESQTQTRA